MRDAPSTCTLTLSAVHTSSALLLLPSPQGYLTAKRERMDHLLDGSWCYWEHDGEPSQPSSAAADASGMGLPPGMRAATKSLKVVPPSLASHTVEMDEDDEAGPAAAAMRSSSSSSSSSSAFALPAVPAAVRNGSSSSSSSSSSSGEAASSPAKPQQ
jgi:hypothetical protein